VNDDQQAAVARGYDQVADEYARLEHAAEWPRMRWLDEVQARLEWLDGGGLLLFSVEPEDQPGLVGQWLGVPMYFSSYAPDVTRRLVREAGFGIVRDALETQREGTTDVTYLWILARKPAGQAQ
jgi:hypothetical protein